MGGESMFDTNAAISGPGLNSQLNQQQRAALAEGNIDAALALRGRV